ncbi:hypothetical protein LTR95_008398 [Oleoguttula sp. CCFEE 5521]
MADTPLSSTSLSLTHVLYNPSSPISVVSAYLALLPQALLIIYSTLLYATREIEVALMLAGQLACEALNYILKRTLKGDRPRLDLGKGYGMPSSHAQFMAYWAVYLGLWVVVRHRPALAKRREGGYVGIAVWQRGVLGLAAFVLAAAVGASRVELNYHHPHQVYVGFALGTACALAWFVVTAGARYYGLLDWLLELPPMQWLRMRDLLIDEDLVHAGWERYDNRRQKLHAVKDR